MRARCGRRATGRTRRRRQPHPQLRGAVLDGGGGARVRQRHPRGRHLPSQRPLHRRHASQRRADALPGVPRRTPRAVRRDPLPLGRRRRHDPGQSVWAGAGDLSGGAAHRAHPDLRSRADERCLAHPAIRQHAHHPRAPGRFQHHARDLAQGGGAHRAIVRPLWRRGSARRNRRVDRACRECDARSHRRSSRREVPRRGLSRQRRSRRGSAPRPARSHRRGRSHRGGFYRLVASDQGADQRRAGDGVQRGGEHREILPGPGYAGESRFVQSNRES